MLLCQKPPGRQNFFLSVNGKALAGGERGELANTELADAVALENWRLGAQELFLGADHEVLLESFQIHPGAIVLH